MKPLLNTLVGSALLASATCAIAEPVSYTIDPGHTDVVSESRHFGTSTTRSRFAGKSGTITIDTAAKTGKASITMDMTTITTGVTKLDDHLESIAFFDAAGYPEANFVSTGFTFAGDKVSEITGNLTMKGKTNPVTLKATNYTAI